MLVVDDSTVVRKILVMTLRQTRAFCRATVDEAGNGALALTRLADNRYDLVLADVRMPHVDGLEMVRRLRTEIGDTETPVFLISTLGSEADVQRGLDAGATAYIRKPLSPHAVMKAIEKHFGR